MEQVMTAAMAEAARVRDRFLASEGLASTAGN